MKRALLIGGSIAIVALVAIAVSSALNARAFDRERKAAIAEADSIRLVNIATKQWAAASDARAAAHAQEAERARAASHASDARAARLVRDNSQLQRALADMPNATPSESLGVYKQLVANLDGQVAALAESRDSARSEAAHRAREAAEFRAGKDSANRQLADVERSNARLRSDLAAASAPCRILWMACPSRTAIAVASATVGAIGGFLASR